MTSFSKTNSTWPPHNGGEFIRSEAFGQMVLSVVKKLAKRYPKMDFTYAAASTFEWFDVRLSKDSSFISSTRFPTEEAFKAYTRQALWRASQLTERQRRSYMVRTERTVAERIAPNQATPLELESTREAVMLLPEPHRTIFLRVLLYGENPSTVADALKLTPQIVMKLYEDAIDLLLA